MGGVDVGVLLSLRLDELRFLGEEALFIIAVYYNYYYFKL